MIFWKQIVRMQLHKRLNARDLAPRARFELATLRLTAERIENLSALSGVAYEKLGAIFPSLVAPTPAPTAQSKYPCSVGVFRMQRNFEPMKKQVESSKGTRLPDETAKLVIYRAFVAGELDAPKHLVCRVHVFQSVE